MNRKIISFDKISSCNSEYLPRKTFDRALNKCLCMPRTTRQKWKLNSTIQGNVCMYLCVYIDTHSQVCVCVCVCHCVCLCEHACMLWTRKTNIEAEYYESGFCVCVCLCMCVCVSDQEKVVNPSNLVASRILGWQWDFDQVSRTCRHLHKIWMVLAIFRLTLFNFGVILAIFGQKVCFEAILTLLNCF